MAKEKNGLVNGTVGPVVFYVLNGKKVIRSKPRPKTKRTLKKKTKVWAAAMRFGIASKKSGTLRRQASFVLHGIDVRKTRYGFDKIIMDWLHRGQPNFVSGPGTPSPFDGFDFNSEAPLSQQLPINVTIDWEQEGKVVINIPELALTPDLLPMHTSASTLQWIIQIASESMEDVGEEDSVWTSFETSIRDKTGVLPARRVEIPKRLKDGQLMVAILSLRYKFNDITISDVKWMPVGIIGARYVAM